MFNAEERKCRQNPTWCAEIIKQQILDLEANLRKIRDLIRSRNAEHNRLMVEMVDREKNEKDLIYVNESRREREATRVDAKRFNEDLMMEFFRNVKILFVKDHPLRYMINYFDDKTKVIMKDCVIRRLERGDTDKTDRDAIDKSADFLNLLVKFVNISGRASSVSITKETVELMISKFSLDTICRTAKILTGR